MVQYVRNKLEFRGTPDTLNPIVQQLVSDDGKVPISFSKIIPLNDESEMEEKWGIPSEPEEMDWILYRDGTYLEYSFDTCNKTPLPVFQKLAEMYPDRFMKVEFASEDYGENCGIYKKAEGSTELVFEEPDYEPLVFACEIWGIDPEEEMAERMINEYEE